jgi:hypothetical protein
MLVILRIAWKKKGPDFPGAFQYQCAVNRRALPTIHFSQQRHLGPCDDNLSQSHSRHAGSHCMGFS